jgi:hypothetical protein
MWAMGLGQVEQWPARQLGITYKRIQGASAKDKELNYQNLALPLPYYTVHLPLSFFVPILFLLVP